MSKLVMVIDDSQTVRKIIETCLGREGYEVLAFPDGVEALRYLHVYQDRPVPDLILLDIVLPKLNGLQIARHLGSKPEYAAIPLVVVSRCNGVVDRLKARIWGVQDYLCKPFTTQDLLKIVGKYVPIQQKEQ